MIRRLIRSLTTWPGAGTWAGCALIGVAGVAVLTGAAALAGLWSWQPRFAGWPAHLALVMLVPALTEEAAFRGLLIPDRGESRHAAAWIAGGVAVFTLWHVVEVLTFLPGARPLFLTPGFLVCAAILGTTCALLRYHSRSLWPAVLFHGLVVFLWQTCLGGPEVKELLSLMPKSGLPLFG